MCVLSRRFRQIKAELYMINYLDYIQGTPLPSTGDPQKDAELARKHSLYSNDKPLSDADPIALGIVTDRLFKPFELIAKSIKPAYKAVKRLVGFKQTDDLLANIYKYIGGHKPGPSVADGKGIFTAAEKEQIKLLQDAGVDLSKISIEDLTTMMSKRQDDIIASAPGRINVVNKTDGGWSITDGTVTNGDFKPHGKTKVNVTDGDVTITNITAYDNAGKVSERAYNTAIQSAQQSGYDGITSGNLLVSAPKTYKVWDHFPNKEVIGNTGIHSNTMVVNSPETFIKVSNVDDMAQATAQNIGAMNPKGQVIKIKGKSHLHTPAKSTTLTPTIIDNNGKMQIDWSNPDLFKTVVPISVLSLGTNRSEDQNNR